MFDHGCLNEIDVNILNYSDSWTLFGTVGLLSWCPEYNTLCMLTRKEYDGKVHLDDFHKTKETPREENALSVSVYMP
jgi:hypothetical protein